MVIHSYKFIVDEKLVHIIHFRCVLSLLMPILMSLLCPIFVKIYTYSRIGVHVLLPDVLNHVYWSVRACVVSCSVFIASLAHPGQVEVRTPVDSRRVLQQIKHDLQTADTFMYMIV